MQVTSNSNSAYTSNTNKSSQSKGVDEETKSKILTTEELLDEEGNEYFNELLAGMSDEDQNFAKLYFSFQLSIKSENVVNGKLQIERETGEVDSQSILSKLDLLIAKRKDNILINDISNKIDYIVDELKAFYTDKAQNKNNNTNINEKEDSVIDDFLEDLYSTNSIESASTLVKEDMKNKVGEYAKILVDVTDETEKTKIINEYKEDLLKEYKDILETINDETPSLKQQGITKALLDENSKETSYFESLLGSVD